MAWDTSARINERHLLVTIFQLTKVVTCDSGEQHACSAITLQNCDILLKQRGPSG